MGLDVRSHYAIMYNIHSVAQSMGRLKMPVLQMTVWSKNGVEYVGIKYVSM